MGNNPYDQGSRYLSKLDPEGVFGFWLKMPAEAFEFVDWLDTRGIAFPGDPERVCDTVGHLRDRSAWGVPWAIVLEFQVSPDAMMFGRLEVYKGLVWCSLKPSPERGDRFAVGALVINLTGTGNSDRTMEWSAADQRTITGKVDRNLNEYDANTVLADIEAGRVSRVILPWLVLMKQEGESGIIERWKAIAASEPDTRKRADYGGLALVYAELTDHADAWKDALKEWNVIESKQVKEWQALARDEGRTEMLIDVLEGKFGSVPAPLSVAIRKVKAIEELKKLAVLAGKATSLEQFATDSGLQP